MVDNDWTAEVFCLKSEMRLNGNRNRSRLWGENEKGVILSNGGLATMGQGMCMSLIVRGNLWGG